VTVPLGGRSATRALRLAFGAPAGSGFAGDQHAIAKLHLGRAATSGFELEIEPLADAVPCAE
jgi:hypothetical protein